MEKTETKFNKLLNENSSLKIALKECHKIIKKKYKLH